ncbi:MAG: sodium:calcium antiporter [Candidatus Micrarchaeia archaeon]|jgi:cation:H+ antiporter
MVILNLALFLAALFVLVKSAEHAVNYSSKLAKMLGISEFIVSFFLIAFISCFPEATVAVVSSIDGVPEFGLGTLLGSNVADLALVFGLVAMFSMNGIKVKSEILKNDLLYLLLLLVPIILGIDGHLSRTDGALLVLSGAIFLLTLSIQSKMFTKKFNDVKDHSWAKNLVLLAISLAFLVAGAYYTVKFGVDFANDISLPPILIALSLVSIGTCMPELVFSLNAVKKRHYELALGDILGTVIIDATILVGVMALIKPFDFDPMIIYVTGGLMVVSGALAISFIRSEKILSKKEGMYLLLFYILSLIIQFIANG